MVKDLQGRDLIDRELVPIYMSAVERQLRSTLPPPVPATISYNGRKWKLWANYSSETIAKKQLISERKTFPRTEFHRKDNAIYYIKLIMGKK
jgi:hypothetical protein